MTKTYLISTVGISLLRNALPVESRGSLFKIANLVEAELDGEAFALVRSAVQSAEKLLAEADRVTVKRLSAELNGVLSYEDEFETAPQIHHVLLITDTHVGRVAGEVLSEWLMARGMSADSWAIQDLRTAHLDEFRGALSSLVPDLVQRIEDAEDTGWRVVFKLTGGFRGVNGFLQSAAMLWASETIYVFEGSDELMHIPRLPVGLNTDQIMEEQFELFQHMAKGREITVEQARKAGIAGSLLLEVDGKATLSEWGKLIWQKAYSEISGSRLLEPPHEKIIFTDGFRRSVKGLSGERMRQVNRAVLAHARFLNGKPEGQLKANTFKQLTGKSKLPSTHERYAWSDGGAWRLYLHQDGGNWIIDELGPHM